MRKHRATCDEAVESALGKQTHHQDVRDILAGLLVATTHHALDAMARRPTAKSKIQNTNPVPEPDPTGFLPVPVPVPVPVLHTRTTPMNPRRAQVQTLSGVGAVSWILDFRNLPRKKQPENRGKYKIQARRLKIQNTRISPYFGFSPNLGENTRYKRGASKSKIQGFLRILDSPRIWGKIQDTSEAPQNPKYRDFSVFWILPGKIRAASRWIQKRKYEILNTDPLLHSHVTLDFAGRIRFSFIFYS